jgi:hypothetical protein
MKPKKSLKKSLLAGIIASGFALVINGIMFFVFFSNGKISNDFNVDVSEPLTIMNVVFSSILPCLIGALLFFVVGKITKRDFGVFIFISISYVQLSFLKSFFLESEFQYYNTFYAMMHLVDIILLLHFIYNNEGYCLKKSLTIKK